MVIFHSYVSLPEGNWTDPTCPTYNWTNVTKVPILWMVAWVASSLPSPTTSHKARSTAFGYSASSLGSMTQHNAQKCWEWWEKPQNCWLIIMFKTNNIRLGGTQHFQTHPNGYEFDMDADIENRAK
jgi:hypothetical protein